MSAHRRAARRHVPETGARPSCAEPDPRLDRSTLYAAGPRLQVTSAVRPGRLRARPTAGGWRTRVGALPGRRTPSRWARKDPRPPRPRRASDLRCATGGVTHQVTHAPPVEVGWLIPARRRSLVHGLDEKIHCLDGHCADRRCWFGHSGIVGRRTRRTGCFLRSPRSPTRSMWRAVKPERLVELALDGANELV